MKYTEHCKAAKGKYGKDWSCVHRWLDEYAKAYFPSKTHRAHRHHVEGVEEVRRLWGDEAADAAIQHIMLDMEDMEDYDSKEVPTQAWWDNWINNILLYGMCNV